MTHKYVLFNCLKIAVYAIELQIPGASSTVGDESMNISFQGNTFNLLSPEGLLFDPQLTNFFIDEAIADGLSRC